MKNSKKAFNVFKTIIILLFIVFLINYFQIENGYYKSKINEKTIITEEKIKEFEEDVKNNEYIDIKDYIEDDYVDTSNFASKAGYQFSYYVSDFVTDKVIETFKLIGKMFT